MNIVFATDNNYVVHLTASLASLISNNKNNDLNIIILHGGLTEVHQNNIMILKKLQINQKIDISFIDCTHLIHSYNQRGYISKAAMYRLYLPILLPNINKVLYIDPDTIIKEDLSSLYNEDISNYYVAGCRDLILVHLLRSIGKISFQGKRLSWEEYYQHLGLSYANMYHYVQSGVLVFNLEKIRYDNKTNLMINLFAKYQSLVFHDQDILNIAFQGEMKLLDIRYNFYDPRNQLLHGNLGASEYSEYELAKYNPAIIHFTGGDKPWNFKKNYFLCYYKEYFKYLQLTAYKLPYTKLKLLLMLNNLRLCRRILFQIKETKKFVRFTILGVTITINWSKIFKWY